MIPHVIGHRLLDRLAQGEITLEELERLARRWAEMLADVMARGN